MTECIGGSSPSTPTLLLGSCLSASTELSGFASSSLGLVRRAVSTSKPLTLYTMVVFDGHEFLTEEEKRLKEDRERTKYWKKWGPYVAERQWATGTPSPSPPSAPRANWLTFPQLGRTTAPMEMPGIVRAPLGRLLQPLTDPCPRFPARPCPLASFQMGRGRNRWRLGHSWVSEHCIWLLERTRVCSSLGLTPNTSRLIHISDFLKERLFGLSNPQGNHGESIKEAHFHLDNTPVSAILMDHPRGR